MKSDLKNITTSDYKKFYQNLIIKK